MKLQKFEEVCQKSKMKVVHRTKLHGMEVIIADGLQPAGPDNPTLVRRTTFAVGYEIDKLLIAQAVDFDKDIIENIRVENRVKKALEKAGEVTLSFKQSRERQEREGASVH